MLTCGGINAPISQGLANMLWSYAKLPVAPPAVVMALVSKITDQLVQHSQRPDGSPAFDAQVSLRKCPPLLATAL